MTIDTQKQAALVSLEKAMKVSMEKGNDPGEIGAQVECYIDVSGSMYGRYQVPGQSGTPVKKRKFFGKKDTAAASTPTVAKSEMDETVTRNLGLLLTGLDDDGKLPVWAFDSRLIDVGEVDDSNYTTFMADMLKKVPLGGGTLLSPSIMNALQRVPSNKENPKVVIIHNDGDIQDEQQATELLFNAADKNVFWIFVGHGARMDFLRKLDTMGGRVVDNVALLELQDASDMDDEAYYDALLKEFIVEWLPAARKAGITK